MTIQFDKLRGELDRMAKEIAELAFRRYKGKEYRCEDARIAIAAIERRARFFGLDAPQKTALTDPSGENPYRAWDNEKLMSELIREIKKSD